MANLGHTYDFLGGPLDRYDVGFGRGVPRVPQPQVVNRASRIIRSSPHRPINPARLVSTSHEYQFGYATPNYDMHLRQRYVGGKLSSWTGPQNIARSAKGTQFLDTPRGMPQGPSAMMDVAKYAAMGAGALVGWHYGRKPIMMGLRQMGVRIPKVGLGETAGRIYRTTKALGARTIREEPQFAKVRRAGKYIDLTDQGSKVRKVWKRQQRSQLSLLKGRAPGGRPATLFERVEGGANFAWGATLGRPDLTPYKTTVTMAGGRGIGVRSASSLPRRAPVPPPNTAPPPPRAQIRPDVEEVLLEPGGLSGLWSAVAAKESRGGVIGFIKRSAMFFKETKARSAYAWAESAKVVTRGPASRIGKPGLLYAREGFRRGTEVERYLAQAVETSKSMVPMKQKPLLDAIGKVEAAMSRMAQRGTNMEQATVRDVLRASGKEAAPLLKSMEEVERRLIASTSHLTGVTAADARKVVLDAPAGDAKRILESLRVHSRTAMAPDEFLANVTDEMKRHGLHRFFDRRKYKDRGLATLEDLYNVAIKGKAGGKRGFHMDTPAGRKHYMYDIEDIGVRDVYGPNTGRLQAPEDFYRRFLGTSYRPGMEKKIVLGPETYVDPLTGGLLDLHRYSSRAMASRFIDAMRKWTVIPFTEAFAPGGLSVADIFLPNEMRQLAYPKYVEQVEPGRLFLAMKPKQFTYHGGSLFRLDVPRGPGQTGLGFRQAGAALAAGFGTKDLGFFLRQQNKGQHLGFSETTQGSIADILEEKYYRSEVSGALRESLGDITYAQRIGVRTKTMKGGRYRGYRKPVTFTTYTPQGVADAKLTWKATPFHKKPGDLLLAPGRTSIARLAYATHGQPVAHSIPVEGTDTMPGLQEVWERTHGVAGMPANQAAKTRAGIRKTVKAAKILRSAHITSSHSQAGFKEEVGEQIFAAGLNLERGQQMIGFGRRKYPGKWEEYVTAAEMEIFGGSGIPFMTRRVRAARMAEDVLEDVFTGYEATHGGVGLSVSSGLEYTLDLRRLASMETGTKFFEYGMRSEFSAFNRGLYSKALRNYPLMRPITLMEELGKVSIPHEALQNLAFDPRTGAFLGGGSYFGHLMWKKVLPAMLAWQGFKYVDSGMGLYDGSITADTVLKLGQQWDIERKEWLGDLGIRDYFQDLEDKYPGAVSSPGIPLFTPGYLTRSFAAPMVAAATAARMLSSPLTKGLGALAAGFGAFSLVGGDVLQTGEEAEDIYEGQKWIPVRRGRWWELSKGHFAGEDVEFFKPHWTTIAQKAPQLTDVQYGSSWEYWANQSMLPVPQNLFGIKPLFTDRYHWEQKHYYDRPYPVSGDMNFAEIPFIGPVIGHPISQLFKPPKVMHRALMDYYLTTEHVHGFQRGLTGTEVKEALTSRYAPTIPYEMLRGESVIPALGGIYSVKAPEKSLGPEISRDVALVAIGSAAFVPQTTSFGTFGGVGPAQVGSTAPIIAGIGPTGGVSPYPGESEGLGRFTPPAGYLLKPALYLRHTLANVKAEYGGKDVMGIAQATEPLGQVPAALIKRTPPEMRLRRFFGEERSTDFPTASIFDEYVPSELAAEATPMAIGMGGGVVQAPTKVKLYSMESLIRRSGTFPESRDVGQQALKDKPYSKGRYAQVGLAGSYATRRWENQMFEEWPGIYGWLLHGMLPTQFSGRKHAADVGFYMEESSQMSSMSRAYWDKRLGGLFGRTELYRRLFPRQQPDVNLINPIPNQMPGWIPGRDTGYFQDFKTGDPFTKIPYGEVRMPGSGYEQFYPELKGTPTEQYPLAHKLSILADIAPYSREYRNLMRTATPKILSGEMDREDVEMVKEAMNRAELRKNKLRKPPRHEEGADLSKSQRVWESLYTSPSFMSRKFLGGQYPISLYRQDVLYGEKVPRWEHFIQNYFLDSLRHSAAADNPVEAAGGGAWIGSLVGRGVLGKAVGASVLGTGTAAVNLTVPRKGLIKGGTTRRWEVEEYMDKIKYLRGMSRYAQTGNLHWLQKARDTAYALPSFAPIEDITMVLPSIERRYFRGLVDDPNRKKIMRDTPEFMHRFLKAQWSVKDFKEGEISRRKLEKLYRLAMKEEQKKLSLPVDDQVMEDMQDYFGEHYLPAPDEGMMEPTASLKQAKYRIVSGEAQSLNNYGLWRDDVWAYQRMDSRRDPPIQFGSGVGDAVTAARLSQMIGHRAALGMNATMSHIRTPYARENMDVTYSHYDEIDNMTRFGGAA